MWLDYKREAEIDPVRLRPTRTSSTCTSTASRGERSQEQRTCEHEEASCGRAPVLRSVRHRPWTNATNRATTSCSMAREHDVKFIRLWFTDILGIAEERGDHRRGARGGAGGGRRLRRLVDRGLRAHRRVRHDRDAGPDDVRAPAVAAAGERASRACSATSCMPDGEPFEGDPR